MASLRNAMKTQRVHKERHQPLYREHLGPLEKKKDYRVRAKDQEKKKRVLKVLHKKALLKNPDEFKFHMINSELKDGVHVEKVEDEELTIGNVAQDLTYITHRRSVEKKKIEKLKAQLHMLENSKPKNSHVLFVDDVKAAKTTDAAKVLDTHPSLLGRNFNRPRTSQLASSSTDLVHSLSFDDTSVEKRKAYKELAERISRENKLRILQDKLEVRKRLMENKKKGGEQPKLITEGSNTSAPIYEWPQQRKK